ncbi:FAD-dependent oxidoreductase [Kineococcus sp. LSe6-4]|uniref:FAD-dependent oxidoreductase n=1 Tax=Kineococcus halophytocola TaxID=3234027 RepID=A0ABV4GWB8_9ACTN
MSAPSVAAGGPGLPRGEDPVVVIGAGPAGLAAAEHLLDAGRRVVVVDGAPVVGGLSRSVERWGHRLDLGPHSFLSSSHPESVARWLDLAGAAGGVERTEAVRAAVWRGRVVGFPPRPLDVLRTAGPVTTARFALDRLRPRRPAPGTTGGSAYDALVARHGLAVVADLFVPYCRKYLGVHPRDLSPAFAHKLQGTRRGWTGPVDLLTPRAGTGAVWDELARRLRARGARVLLGTPVVGLTVAGERVTGVRCGRAGATGPEQEQTLAASAVVSSAPAAVLRRWLPGTGTSTPTPAAAPAFTARDTYLVHLRLAAGPGGGVGQNAHYVTAYDPQVRTGRLSNTRSWRPETFGRAPDTVLCAEFWSSGQDDLSARTDDQLAALAVSELPVFGVDPRVRVLDHDVLRLPRSVPVLTRGVEAARAGLDAALDRWTNLTRVGRHGTHDWDGQEDALLTGRSTGAHVLRGA